MGEYSDSGDFAGVKVGDVWYEASLSSVYPYEVEYTERTVFACNENCIAFATKYDYPAPSLHTSIKTLHARPTKKEAVAVLIQKTKSNISSCEIRLAELAKELDLILRSQSPKTASSPGSNPFALGA